jgi:hypothetical protein
MVIIAILYVRAAWLVFRFKLFQLPRNEIGDTTT